MAGRIARFSCINKCGYIIKFPEMESKLKANQWRRALVALLWGVLSTLLKLVEEM
ncbi:hypothetical protein Pint_05453 [Pistacia integerrima]|uniref:Uncharacterized protein n=1 Tax=Pistacia integerrima TaxID=434235 RepID=A0ACC0Z614_9ROSI|nr:hypothetical protein Pint_05453 [Pistacia integerrima]